MVSAYFRIPLELGLHATFRSAIDSVARGAGAQEVRTGNDSFDARVVIRGNPPHDITALFADLDVRQRVLDLPLSPLPMW